jgi:uncharacterized protein GlcG (DUF336 family)
LNDVSNVVKNDVENVVENDVEVNKTVCLQIQWEMIMQNVRTRLVLVALTLGFSATTWSQDEATFSSLSLSPATALQAAQAALKVCQDAGFNVAVAVADRGGVTQVMLRDRFAGAHTPETAMGKAWTAASFRTNTSDLLAITLPGHSSYGIRHLPGVVVLGGGMTIEAKGSLVGSIGISGSPTGADDDRCAKAGIEAIRVSLEL